LESKLQIGGNRPGCDMRWFRSNRKTGGRLALFALALQFVLSFGHIHREDIYGTAPAAAAPTTAALTSVDRLPSAPSDPSSKHTDDYCAICATISLLSNSFVAALPQLPLPAVSHVVDHDDYIAALSVPPRRTSFQSRAPPTA
jgi:hypothetical protein